MAVNASGSTEEFTTRYQALLCHYGVTGEATNAASAHENGDCEQSHRRLKEAIDQALLLRGRRDFATEQTERAIALMKQPGNMGPGLALLMGEKTPLLIVNMLTMLKEGLLEPVEIIARA